jgi:cytidine diphosphoramidate kinase
MAHTGTVYWITGLAGSGKSTIAQLLAHHLRELKRSIVFLDGDELREVYGETTDYSLTGRREIAMRNGRLCRLLSNQGHDVVCSTISLFHECHSWNRENIVHYREVFLKVSMEVLIERDQKGLYSRALKGEMKNVFGVDLEAEYPVRPDVIIKNNGSQTPQKAAMKCFLEFGLGGQ